MIDRTLFLSGLIVLATIAPSELVRVGSYLGGYADDEASQSRQKILYRYGMPLLYALLGFLVLYLTPQESRWASPAAFWYVVALALAPVLIGIEIVATFAWLRLIGKRVGRVILKPLWEDSALSLVISTVIVGGAEELIFRGVWITLLADTHSLPVALAVVVSAIVYGLNHSFFGIMTTLQKSVSGIFYGIVFVMSGYAVIIPIVVHISQNVLVIAAGKRAS